MFKKSIFKELSVAVYTGACVCSYSRTSEVGVCRESDTPTIYVGDIDMYIPLEKNLIPSHANCMQHVGLLRCWERQSDGSEYKKTLRRPGLRPGSR